MRGIELLTQLRLTPGQFALKRLRLLALTILAWSRLARLFRAGRLRAELLRPGHGATRAVARKSVVAQLLLFAHHIVDVAHRPAGARGLRRAPIAEIFEDVLDPVEHAHGGVPVALPGVFRHSVKHRLEILRRHQTAVAGRAFARLILFCRPFPHCGDVAIERLLQTLGQPRDFLARGAVPERVPQGLLRRLEVTFGLWNAAFLDVQGHFPKQVGDRRQIGVVAGVAKRVHGRREARDRRRNRA